MLAAWQRLTRHDGALDLGWFRLKGLEQPERLWQVLPAPLADRQFPPPRTEPWQRGHVPERSDEFVGREELLTQLDQQLAAAGMERHVALVLPHWSAALDVVAGTDLILTVAARTLAAMPAQAALRAFAPPVALLPIAFQQAWHARRDDDPAHRWLRNTVRACCHAPD